MVRDHIVGMPVIRAFNRKIYENYKEIVNNIYQDQEVTNAINQYTN